jgi:hypothetical protein
MALSCQKSFARNYVDPIPSFKIPPPSNTRNFPLRSFASLLKSTLTLWKQR